MAEWLVLEFADRAVELFDPIARQAGGIKAEDRYGVSRFFPMTTISIWAVKIQSGEFSSAEEVASLAAQAKHQAKTQGSELFILDRTDMGPLTAAVPASY